ncbi:TVP38/TMEM64 family protein [Bacillus dakarensis]|uniref:TVP38/TMEM64 family protein n=1 Tax=Robertmurraya dakarensis TaxID=1926278 RepID=UPI0009810AE8|nr:VTT domain-containing protein [Bacillus dakarensis]
MKKWLILIIYAAAILYGLKYKDFILDWIQSSETGNLHIHFVLSILTASIPVIPFTLFAGLMGAKYGVLMGTFINWIGGVFAAVLYFVLARTFLKNYFEVVINRMKGIQRFQFMLEKNAFIALLMVRMLPIVPPPVVNLYSGMGNIPLSTFFTATAIGQIPPMFLIAYSGHQIFTSLLHLILGISLYIVFTLSILFIYRAWFVKAY